jgi:hypothetical protein
MKTFLIFFLLCLKGVFGSFLKDDIGLPPYPEERPMKAYAHDHFQENRYYSKEEVWNVFSPYLDESMKNTYNSALNLMFEKFPQPIHSEGILRKGWLCWLEDIMNKNPEDQENALLKRLKIHKKLTEEHILPSMAYLSQRLENAPFCEKCVQRVIDDSLQE